MKAILMQWTVWQFRGVTVPQEPVVAARATELFEPEHEYQKVLGRVAAYNEREALQRLGFVAGGA